MTIGDRDCDCVVVTNADGEVLAVIGDTEIVEMDGIHVRLGEIE